MLNIWVEPWSCLANTELIVSDDEIDGEFTHLLKTTDPKSHYTLCFRTNALFISSPVSFETHRFATHALLQYIEWC